MRVESRFIHPTSTCTNCGDEFRDYEDNPRLWCSEWCETNAARQKEAVAAARAEGYTSAIQDVCAVLAAAAADYNEKAYEDGYGAGENEEGQIEALDAVRQVVRKLAPVESGSNADGLSAEPKDGTR